MWNDKRFLLVFLCIWARISIGISIEKQKEKEIRFEMMCWQDEHDS